MLYYERVDEALSSKMERFKNVKTKKYNRKIGGRKILYKTHDKWCVTCYNELYNLSVKSSILQTSTVVLHKTDAK